MVGATACGYRFSSSVAHDMARNLLAFTLYGDPSLPILSPEVDAQGIP